MDPFSLSISGIFVFLLICSWFFSATETAFSSASEIKLKNMAQEGNKKAALALEITDQYDRFLTTVLVGNNIVNILAASLATVFFVGHFGKAGVSAATAITTVLVLIFGEISPKTLAKETPEKIAMFSARPIRLFMFLFSPINFISSQWKKLIIKIFRVHADNKATEAELLTFVEEVRQDGGINEGEEHMIRNAIEFDDLTANDILTPRVDITAVSVDDSLEEIEKCFYESGYSRLPVYRDSIDTIIGVILLKDFVSRVLKNHEPLNAVIKPVIFSGETIKLSKLLKKLQTKKTHFSVILDEYGGTMGIVTLEDIVEELVGEIWDEHDDVTENIISLADGCYRINGNTPLKDFCDTLGIEEKEIATNATTVNGFVIEHLGEIPQEGYNFTFNNYSVTILKASLNKVIELMASPNAPPDPEGNPRPAASAEYTGKSA
jgi:CBS domain containing-hemolysin-like protein